MLSTQVMVSTQYRKSFTSGTTELPRMNPPRTSTPVVPSPVRYPRAVRSAQAREPTRRGAAGLIHEMSRSTGSDTIDSEKIARVPKSQLWLLVARVVTGASRWCNPGHSVADTRAALLEMVLNAGSSAASWN